MPAMIGEGAGIMFKSNHRKPRKAILTALSVFVAGFGVLNVFYLTRSDSPQLRGLYTYWSATLGDGLLLPVAVFSLIRALRAPGVKGVRLFATTGAMVGVLSGIGLQYSWLSDPHPALNWTLPAPGHFNAAGWYHAAFLTGMCGLLTGLAAALIKTISADRDTRLDRAPWIAVAAVVLLVFALLLLVDNVDTASAASSRITLVTLAVAIVLLSGVTILLSCWRRRLQHHQPELPSTKQRTTGRDAAK